LYALKVIEFKAIKLFRVFLARFLLFSLLLIFMVMGKLAVKKSQLHRFKVTMKGIKRFEDIEP
jgi:hypothetical protein